MKNKFKVGDKIIFNHYSNSKWIGRKGMIVSVPTKTVVCARNEYYILKEYPSVYWTGMWFDKCNPWEDICI